MRGSTILRVGHLRHRGVVVKVGYANRVKYGTHSESWPLSTFMFDECKNIADN